MPSDADLSRDPVLVASWRELADELRPSDAPRAEAISRVADAVERAGGGA